MKQVKYQKRLVAVESLAEEVEARLILLEGAAGNSPEAKVSKVLSAIPELCTNADGTEVSRVVNQKSSVLESLAKRLSARVDVLEAMSPSFTPACSSTSPPSPQSARNTSLITMNQAPLEKNIVRATQKASSLEGFAEQLEARLMFLEAAAGKTPQAEVTQTFYAMKELCVNAGTTATPSVLNEKTSALESLGAKLSARISTLETDSPRLHFCNCNTSQMTTKQVQFDEQLSDPSRQTSTDDDMKEDLQPTSQMTTKQVQFDEQLSDPSRQTSTDDDMKEDLHPVVCTLQMTEKEDCVTEKHVSSSQKAATLDGLAQEFEDRLMLLIEQTLSEASQQSFACELLADKLEASLSTAKTGNAPRQRSSPVAADELLHRTKLQELERAATQANDALLEIQETHSKEILRLREELMRVASAANKERRAGDLIIKRLELELRQSSERGALREQFIRELEAKLAATEAQLSSKHAILHEDTMKAIEAKLDAAAAERRKQHEQDMKELEAKLAASEAKSAAAEAALQDQSSELAALHKQTIKQLEAKVVSAAANRRRKSNERDIMYKQAMETLEAKLKTAHDEIEQLATLRESLQKETLEHKQRVSEHEQRIEALTNDKTQLQLVLQEHKEMISLQVLEFEGERKGLLKEIEELKRKTTVLEQAHMYLSAKWSNGALGVLQH